MCLPGIVKEKDRFPKPGESPIAILKAAQATQSCNIVVTKHLVNSKQFHSCRSPGS